MSPSAGEERKHEIFERALAEIQSLDLDEQSANGDFQLRPSAGGGKSIHIPSFGHILRISLPDGSMEIPAAMDSFSLRILALRYIRLSCPQRITGEWIAYRDLPGGRFYAATLVPTVEQPIARSFGRQKGLLGRAASEFGGKKSDYGDESYVFHPFPKTPLLLVLHWGDEEFEPACRILFDRCCPRFLNTDDLKIVATQLAAYLLKWAGAEIETENLLWMVE